MNCKSISKFVQANKIVWQCPRKHTIISVVGKAGKYELTIRKCCLQVILLHLLQIAYSSSRVLQNAKLNIGFIFSSSHSRTITSLHRNIRLTNITFFPLVPVHGQSLVYGMQFELFSSGAVIRISKLGKTQ